MSVAAVLPGYNEEETIENVVKKTKKHVDEVYYVDDGSQDDSPRLADRAGATVIEYGKNIGKGFALRTGLEIASRKHDILVTMDSDGQHHPKDIPRLLKAIKYCDFVIGSRYGGRFYTIPRNVLGNFGLNFVTNMLSYGPQGFFRDEWVSDTQSGMKAITAEAFHKMDLTARSYQIDSEMVYEAAQNKLKVKEIPIKVRIWVKGVTVLDGLRNGLWVLKRRLKL